jgi:hypothetical protein
MLRALALCDATYLTEAGAVAERFRELGCDDVRVLEPTLTSCRAVVARRRQRGGLVVAVRGTVADTPVETRANILSDLLALPVPPVGLKLGGRAHAGWYAQLGWLHDPVLQTLTEDHGWPDAPLLLTGFSLGGAIAQGLWLALRHHAEVQCMSFAAPRFGTRSLARLLEPDRVTRVRLQGDVLATLPPWPFQHGGRLVELPRVPAQRAHTRAAYRFALSR